MTFLFISLTTYQSQILYQQINHFQTMTKKSFQKLDLREKKGNIYNKVGRLSRECIRAADPHFMRPLTVTGPVIITVINSIPSTSSKTIFMD